MQRYIALLALLILFTGSAFAQDNSGVSLAGVSGNQIMIRAVDGTETAIPLPDGSGVQSLAWNGSQLAAILYDQTYQAHLWTLDAQGTLVMLESGPLEAGFPVSFTPDGSILYAQAQPIDYAMTSPADYYTSIAVIAPQAGAQPIVVGNFTFTVGCGGGSPLPGDWLYWQEAGFGGSSVVLQWTEQGILHSLACSGDGLGLLDPNSGQDRVIVPAFTEGTPQTYISRPKLSPDGQRLAAIKTVYDNNTITTNLVLVDLASGTVTDLATAQQPHQLAWINDSTITYSWRIETGEILGSLTPEQHQLFDTTTGGTGMTLSTWQVSINSFDLTTNAEQTVYTGDGYQVGRMDVSVDGSLWFSLIPNQTAWVNAIVSGQLDPMTASITDVLAYLPLALYRLDTASGTVELVTESLNQFTMQP